MNTMKLPDDFYVLQDKNYGLGNFINLTPAIKAMADKFDKKIPVYFELEHVKQCFLDCEFMEILEDQPFNKTDFGSFIICRDNSMPDYIYAYLYASQLFGLSDLIGHTYVDQPKEYDVKSYRIFICGSGSEEPAYLQKNQPDKRYYLEYLNDNSIFTGSTKDLRRSDWANDIPCYIDDIRHSLALISAAEMVVSNDTGLTHAAGAMNKEMIVLWKTNMLPKSANPGKNTLIKMCI